MDSPQTELRPLSEPRCWELLENRTVGRLAVSINGNPDIFPVNYGVDDRRIVIRTGEGLKLAAAVLGKSVAFEVDGLDATRRTGWSIVVKGQADEPERLEEYLDKVDLDITPWAAGTKSRFIVITPTEVTGRVLPPAISGCLFE